MHRSHTAHNTLRHGHVLRKQKTHLLAHILVDRKQNCQAFKGQFPTTRGLPQKILHTHLPLRRAHRLLELRPHSVVRGGQPNSRFECANQRYATLAQLLQIQRKRRLWLYFEARLAAGRSSAETGPLRRVAYSHRSRSNIENQSDKRAVIEAHGLSAKHV